MLVTTDIHPYRILDVKANESRGVLKSLFRQKIQTPWRISRVLVSLSYHLICHYKQEIVDDNINVNFVIQNQFFQAVVGNTGALKTIFSRDKSGIARFNEDGCTVLYIAARGGFYDTCRYIISLGANVNHRQSRGSTALHAASYFGHKLVVGLLLQSGADTSIVNDVGNTAADESANEEIRQLIIDAKTNKIDNFVRELTKKGLVNGIQLIHHPSNENEIIAREFTRADANLDFTTAVEVSDILNTWTPSWHRTRFINLTGIIEKGLIPAGTHGILPPDNHIKLGRKVDKFDNWAAAIFVSPNVTYASHAAYSERILVDSKQWCCLIKTYCDPKHYTEHGSTLFGFKQQMKNAPIAEEYRVEVPTDKDIFLRIEMARHVLVRSAVFVDLNFLENLENEDYDTVHSRLVNGDP